MPRIRIINSTDVSELLTEESLREALTRALIAQSKGKANVPPRIAAHSANGLLSAMPGYLEDVGMATKLVTVFPDNVDLPSHMGVIALFDSSSGLPLSFMDGEVITRDRTACTASIAADHLAREDAEVLTIVGAGVQGEAHLSFFENLRRWTEINVVSRTEASSAEVAASSKTGVAKSLPYEELESAVRASDTVALCTHAQSAVISGDWVADGCHVSSVGSFAELPRDLVVSDGVTLVADHIGAVSTPPPAGAEELQGLDPARVAELGAVLAGDAPGRSSTGEITVYKSTGHAVQDIATARMVYEMALDRNVGLDVDV